MTRHITRQLPTVAMLLTLLYLPLKACIGQAVTVLHSFGDGTVADDGSDPLCTPVEGADGCFYGTTQYGGSTKFSDPTGKGYGVVFKMSNAGVVTIIHSFSDGSVVNDGMYPYAGLTKGDDGALYGTTYGGGEPKLNSGVVFRITTSGSYSILHRFQDGSVTNDGACPEAALLLSSDGWLYGTTLVGGGTAFNGQYGYGDGTVFKISESGAYSVLHRFGEGSTAHDGYNPMGALVASSDGTFYGTTWVGGAADRGTVYEMSMAGSVTIVHSFCDGSVTDDGWNPIAGLAFGADGSLYGTTSLGGIDSGFGGTVYRYSTTGSYNVVHRFGDGTILDDGAEPCSGVVLASDGYLYGATSRGGGSLGSIYRVSPHDTLTVMQTELGIWPYVGFGPYGGLIQATDGNLYGTTMGGSLPDADSDGTVFRMTFFPAMPTGLAAVTWTNRVALKWTGVALATTYNLYRSTVSGGEGATPIAAALSATVFTDTSVTNGTKYYYTVAGVNSLGTGLQSAEASAAPVMPAASLARIDSTTLGSWKGNYGADGWNVINDPSYATLSGYYNYATVIPTGVKSALWNPGSTAAYALQESTAGSPDRVLGAWYSSTSFSIDVNITDGSQHQMAFYLYDWASCHRTERITFSDPVTHNIIDSETASNFVGAYYVWNVKGHFTVTISKSGGPNCVLSGIFFGAGTGDNAPTAPAKISASGGQDSIGISWTACDGATSYDVYRSQKPGDETTTPYATEIYGPGYTDTAVAPGVAEYYQVLAVNAVGGSPSSAEVHAKPMPLAQFLDKDTTTTGSWVDHYGTLGYNVIEDVSLDNPRYMPNTSPAAVGNCSVLWTPSSSQPDCLQSAEYGSTNRLAGAWYSPTSFSIGINQTGYVHEYKLSLYLLDWNEEGREESIKVSDPATGTVLDTETAIDFAGGVYYTWLIYGDVNIALKRLSGPNAVVSALFFDDFN